jgi:hypothetical protein
MDVRPYGYYSFGEHRYASPAACVKVVRSPEKFPERPVRIVEF